MSMAEEGARELNETSPAEGLVVEDRDIEAAGSPKDGTVGLEAVDGFSNGKRTREMEVGGEEEGDTKKQKVDSSEEDERPSKESARVKIGGKEFESSVEMFDYFIRFLRAWPLNISVNKYEHMMLLELIKKGHADPEKKIGSGVKAFQIRSHPHYRSNCFFLLREDGSVEDFSFRKCVDHILPLLENMQVKPSGKNLPAIWKGKGGDGGGGRRGRGGKGRF
ncbi:hypothetical protein SAY87_010800 [Trapa incisa]|uniref:Uncharacterized protein n=1 Tax=Trapa incisa TaxID=236973 RepID=A0AAN7JIN6_9MYRT|nr:hypothetical protein SAY87_010800 [Trapa incisa]